MLGQLIKELRSNRYSQRDLALLLNVSHSYISKIENSNELYVDDERLLALARILGCEEDIIFFAANRIPPKYREKSLTQNLSIYQNLKSQWLSMIQSHAPSEHFEYLYHAFEQSKFGYAIIRRDDLETMYVSDELNKILKELCAENEKPKLHLLIPNISFILKQYTIGTTHRRGILPISNSKQMAFVEFYAHHFYKDNVQYILIEMVNFYDDLEGYKFMLGVDFCLQPFFENMQLGLLMVKCEDNQLSFLNCNDFICNMLGYSRDMFTRQELSYTDIEFPTEAQNHREKIITQNKSMHYTTIFIHSDGHIIPAEVYGHLFEIGMEKGFFYLIKPLI